MSAEAMTERFEMRLGQSVLERVDAWRGQQSDVPSRSEAVRRLVEVGLGATGKNGHLKLGDGDKLILTMLCQLLKQLKLKSEIDPEFVEAAIYGGHYWGLEWEYPHLFHGTEYESSVVSEVVDVLDMWSFLESGFERLSKKEKKLVETEATLFNKNVVFFGFDGNHEVDRLSVANFLIDKLHRFPAFKNRGLDSHMPTIEGYRRMFAVFQPIRVGLIGRSLDTSEIIKILKAYRQQN